MNTTPTIDLVHKELCMIASQDTGIPGEAIYADNTLLWLASRIFVDNAHHAGAYKDWNDFAVNCIHTRREELPPRVRQSVVHGPLTRPMP